MERHPGPGHGELEHGHPRPYCRHAHHRGCTYTGQLSLRPEAKAVVDVAVLEDCAGTQLQFNGVSTPQAEGNRLTLVMATADEAQAVLIPLGR